MRRSPRAVKETPEKAMSGRCGEQRSSRSLSSQPSDTPHYNRLDDSAVAHPKPRISPDPVSDHTTTRLAGLRELPMVHHQMFGSLPYVIQRSESLAAREGEAK